MQWEVKLISLFVKVRAQVLKMRKSERTQEREDTIRRNLFSVFGRSLDNVKF